MKTIFLLIGLCIFAISLFVYLFRPSSQIISTQEKISSTATDQPDKITPNSQNSSSENKEQQLTPSSGKPQKLSAEATQYYKTAIEYGWESIVRDFENGTITRSKMPDDEKNKLCEIALMSTNIDQTKRLFSANCKPSSGRASFSIINGTLTKENGEADQEMIIEKLKFYKEQNLLQTHVTYELGPYKESSSLQNQAIGWGYEKVSDYLLSIGVDYSGTDNNLILDNLSGRNPSVSIIQKLLDAGIEPNKKVFDLMQQKEFASKHPEVYELLQKNHP